MATTNLATTNLATTNLATTTSWRIELDQSGRALSALLDQGVPLIGTTGWLDRMEQELRRLSSALVGFGAQVDDGLYDDVVAQAPRLVPAVGRLRRQQYELRQQIDGCLSTVGESQPNPNSVEVTLRDMVIQLGSHNHRAMALIHDAYDVDLGGQG
jgi:hypothetical protein